MSLEGSLETIALPDVLSLLSATAKSGQLLVDSGERRGRLSFDAGRLVGFAVSRSRTALDAVFELLKLERGRFVFDSEGPGGSDGCSAEGCPTEVAPLLEEAADRLTRWPEIEAAVPALDWRVALQVPPGRPAVSLAPEQWELVVAIGDGGVVGEILWELHRSDFDGCVTLKTLVDDGLVAISAPERTYLRHGPGPVAREGAPSEATPAPPRAENGEDPVVGDADGAADEAASGGETYAEPVALHTEAESPAMPVEVAGPAEHLDGLADRGPWTTGELATLVRMGGWVEAPGDSTPLSEMSPVPPEDGARDDFSGVLDPAEPTSRGRFGKLLSSVRS